MTIIKDPAKTNFITLGHCSPLNRRHMDTTSCKTHQLEPLYFYHRYFEMIRVDAQVL